MIIILIAYYIILLVEGSVLLKARCHCTSGVGMCGRMWSGQYTAKTCGLF